MICKKLQVSVGFVAASDFTVRGFWCVLCYDCCASLLTPGGVLLCFPHVFSPGRKRKRKRRRESSSVSLSITQVLLYVNWNFKMISIILPKRRVVCFLFLSLFTLQAKISRLHRVQSSLLPCRLPSLSSHLSLSLPGWKVEVRCSVCPTALWIRETVFLNQ